MTGINTVLGKLKHFILNRKGFFKKSIKNRIIVLMLLCTSVPITCVTIISYLNSTQATEKRILASNQKMMEWSGNYIKSTIKRLDEAIYNLAADGSFIDNLKNSINEDRSKRLESDNKVVNKIYSFLYSDNDINSVVLYSRVRNKLFYVSNQINTEVSDCDINSAAWYRDVKIGTRGLFINRDEFKIAGSAGFSIIPGNKGISIVRKIIDFTSKDELFSIMLDIKWAAIKDVFDLLKTEDKSVFVVMDKNGQIEYDVNAKDYERSFFQEISGIIKTTGVESGYFEYKNHDCFFYKNLPGEVALIKVVSFSAVNKTARENIDFSIFIGIIFLILALSLALFVVITTVNPIIKLSKTMKEVQQNRLEITIEKFYEDEVGILQRSFVYMIDQIKDLINREYKSKIEKRTAQLKALHAQINPHFLYNSMQMIGGIAVSRGIPEIYSSLKALSDMLRYNVKTQYDNVTIREEFEHVKNYLKIQEMRYRDKIQVKMQIDDEIWEYMIPRLSIQTFIENSFIHGLENKLGLWSIEISGYLENGNVVFEIIDNGVGIPEEKLKEIREGLNSDDIFNSSKSLGIKNVNARIGLSFGFEYGVSIESEEGMGTKVMMKVPACKNQEEKND